MPIDIVVDAMGSDKAPEPEVRGAILAARQFDVRVHLAGPEEIIRPILRTQLKGQKLPVFIVPASEWITMTDKAAAAVRQQARLHHARRRKDGARRPRRRLLYRRQHRSRNGHGEDGLRHVGRSRPPRTRDDRSHHRWLAVPCCSMSAQMSTANLRISFSSP